MALNVLRAASIPAAFHRGVRSARAGRLCFNVCFQILSDRYFLLKTSDAPTEWRAPHSVPPKAIERFSLSLARSAQDKFLFIFTQSIIPMENPASDGAPLFKGSSCSLTPKDHEFVNRSAKGRMFRRRIVRVLER